MKFVGNLLASKPGKAKEAVMKFSFSSGTRPLDGYTIKRGVGRGGFGEVYFAVSDGGKEVALKMIRGDGDVELRGISSCLNLKHHNLVSLYDLRTDSQGNSWVVMEYIAGEPLHVVLNKNPKGLPADVARQWFSDLARGVGYLHDHGIVHRDLKPANIFIEQGLLKVGDYGLCKSMASSARVAQTQAVGTVHYMAPEISTGNYDKQIDVYACGVLLYEMLTGRVPFDGESQGEILMKHLTSTPDLSTLPVAFVPILQKALAKNPSARFQSMAEFVEALEKTDSKALPSLGNPPASSDSFFTVPPPRPLRRDPSIPTVLPVPLQSARGVLGELAGSMALAAVFAALSTALWAAMLGDGNFQMLGLTFSVITAICWAVLVPSKIWQQSTLERKGQRFALLILGCLIGLGVTWLDGWNVHELPKPDRGHGPILTITSSGYVAYFGLAMAASRWWRLTDRRRKNWFSLLPVVGIGIWSLVLSFLWPWNEQPLFGAGALVAASMIVQWVSPWEPPLPPAPKPMKLRYA